MASHGKFPDSIWFWLLEGIITILVIFEVGVRIYIQDCHAYWKSLSNVFDLLVVIVCIIAIAISLWDTDFDEDIGGIGGEILMILRNILQFLRVIVFLKNQQKAQITALKMIDFSQLAEARDEAHAKKDIKGPNPITEEIDENFNFMKHNESEIYQKNTSRLDISSDMPEIKIVN